MVVSTTVVYPINRFIAGNLCGFSSGTIHIFSVLMKKILSCINRLVKPVNKIIICIALTLVYFIICLYHLFIRQTDKRWESNKNNVSLEQTKHLW